MCLTKGLKFQSLLAKTAENMLMAINKHELIMLWHIYIRRNKRNKIKKKIQKHTYRHQEKDFFLNKLK